MDVENCAADATEAIDMFTFPWFVDDADDADDANDEFSSFRFIPVPAASSWIASDSDALILPSIDVLMPVLLVIIIFYY